MEEDRFLSSFPNRREGVPQKAIKSSANGILSLLNLKYQKNQWNQGVKSCFENEFWIGPIPKFALVRIMVHLLKNLNLKICMEFEF